ncbi:hypothetical protein [Massilia phosphatilytica]
MPPIAYAGTAAWQAPEQFFPDAGGRYRTDARSDYFALGALLSTSSPASRCAFAPPAPTPTARTARPARARWAHRRRSSRPTRPRCSSRVLAPDHDALLVLLRALLAPRPDARPRHALEMSRLIARAAQGLECVPGAWRSAA